MLFISDKYLNCISGSMIGILLTGYWVDYKWMWCFFVPGFILAFAGILVFLCMLAHPEDLKQLEKENSLSARSRSLECRLSATKTGKFIYSFIFLHVAR